MSVQGLGFALNPKPQRHPDKRPKRVESFQDRVQSYANKTML